MGAVRGMSGGVGWLEHLPARRISRLIPICGGDCQAVRRSDEFGGNRRSRPQLLAKADGFAAGCLELQKSVPQLAFQRQSLRRLALMGGNSFSA